MTPWPSHRLSLASRLILVTTVAILTLTLLICSLAYAVYAERAAGDERRLPRDAPAHTDSTVTLLVDFRALPGDGSYSAIYLAPDGPNAQLPPGLDRWLAPGELAVSPALATAAGPEGRGLPAGKVVTEISREGLGVADERIAYVGMDDLRSVPGAHPYDGWGSTTPVTPWDVSRTGAVFGESIALTSLATLLMALVLLAVAPALGAVAVACADMRRRQTRRDLLLDALGAPRAWMRRRQMQATLPWITIGLLAGSALALVPVVTGSTVPFTRFQLEPRLLYDHAGASAIGLALAAISSLTLAALSPRRLRLGTRLRESANRLHTWWLAAAVAAVIFTRHAPDLIDPAGGWGWALSYWLGVIAVFALVPWGATYLVIMFARAAGRFARATSRPGLLAGARWLPAHPSVVLLPSVALTMVLGVLFQVVAVTQGTSQNLRDALQLQREVDNTIVPIKIYEDLEASSLMEALPGIDVLKVTMDLEHGQTTMRGTCEAIENLGVACGAAQTPASQAHPAAAALAGYLGAGTSFVGQDETPETLPGDSEGWLVRHDLRSIDPVAAQHAIDSAIGPRARVDLPGGTWITGAQDLAQEGRWVPFFGMIGLLATLSALVVDLASRSRTHADRVATLSVLLGRPGVVGWMTCVSLGAPMFVLGTIAFFTHAYVVAPIVTTVPPIPAPAELLAAPTFLLLTLCSVLLVVTATYSALVASKVWVARG